jgi:hypothetical protein
VRSEENDRPALDWIEDFAFTVDGDVQPLFTALPLSCDAHFHIFGPADRYPHGGVSERPRYAPPFAPLEDYLGQARRLGFERQPNRNIWGKMHQRNRT